MSVTQSDPCFITLGPRTVVMCTHEHIVVMCTYLLGTRRCCDVESMSLTLIQRRNNVVYPVAWQWWSGHSCRWHVLLLGYDWGISGAGGVTKHAPPAEYAIDQILNSPGRYVASFQRCVLVDIGYSLNDVSKSLYRRHFNWYFYFIYLNICRPIQGGHY